MGMFERPRTLEGFRGCYMRALHKTNMSLVTGDLFATLDLPLDSQRRGHLLLRGAASQQVCKGCAQINRIGRVTDLLSDLMSWVYVTFDRFENSAGTDRVTVALVVYCTGRLWRIRTPL